MESIKSGFKNLFGMMSKKHNSCDTNGSEDIENIEPSKKKRKHEEQAINYCPIVNPVTKQTNKKAVISNTLEGLLWDLTKEPNLNAILDNESWNDNIYLPRILKTPHGALADVFQNFLKKRDESEDEKLKKIQKLGFLILIEIVLQCQDKNKREPVFSHLVSLFLDEKSPHYINLKNNLIADELSDENISHDDITRYLQLAKKDANVWEGGKGCLVPIYDVEFRNSSEFKEYSEKNVFAACLLSIL